ncbi:maleylacetoacetate isomerase [Kordiimonas sp. SCSIO 12610]|uniref:maleylacetoacetate isomerase n=1 Tax=Kordiimonas sp. SCSIO 12610 TaxID=2829597 RepID=UPI00210C2E8F|nr:maleylacetoacetate isomerase [Kordiimonas sp. SCSIO 12610]UTW56796.1 maleylacetoacetate isomerase [Kordiimonas sp. SCSIO 12610]
MSERILYGYYRSSAAFRVRIALALKGLDYQYKAVDLKPSANDHKAPDYLAMNPQGRVPFFVDNGLGISQSPAILEYLDEVYPDVPLLPSHANERAWVRQLVNVIGCDIHPLNNLSVLQKLKSEFDADQDAVNSWYSHWIVEGFTALEAMLTSSKYRGDFCFGNLPSMADVYLVPQVWNAMRFQVNLEKFPVIKRIYASCAEHPAFMKSMPENQPDAPAD